MAEGGQENQKPATQTPNKNKAQNERGSNLLAGFVLGTTALIAIAVVVAIFVRSSSDDDDKDVSSSVSGGTADVVPTNSETATVLRDLTTQLRMAVDAIEGAQSTSTPPPALTLPQPIIVRVEGLVLKAPVSATETEATPTTPDDCSALKGRERRRCEIWIERR